MDPARNEIAGVNDPSEYSPVTQSETQETAARKTPDQAFLEKTIHPPSAVAGYEGIPTNDARTQVVMNWVDNRLTETPTTPGAFGEPVNEIQAGAVRGFAFLHTTGMDFPLICFVQYDDSSLAWNQDTTNTKRLDVYPLESFWKDANLFRQCYKSYTYYLNTTAFNNTGAVTTSQFNPAILFAGELPVFFDKDRRRAHKFTQTLMDEGGYFLESDDWPEDFCEKYVSNFVDDKTHKALQSDDPEERAKANVDILNKIVRAAKARWQLKCAKNSRLDIEATNPPFKPPRNIRRIAPDFAYQIINFNNVGNAISGNSAGAVVPTQSQLSNMSTRSFTCPAKEGAYVVNRLNTIDPGWQVASNNRITTSNPSGLYECWFTFNDPLGQDNFAAFTHRGPDGNTRVNRDVLWGTHFTWSWTVFEGLVPNVNIASSQNSAALIQIKGYNG